jgi:hypothetical protein
VDGGALLRKVIALNLSKSELMNCTSLFLGCLEMWFNIQRLDIINDSTTLFRCTFRLAGKVVQHSKILLTFIESS